MPEWLIERGIGETRTVLVGDDGILEARIMLDGIVRAGTVLSARVIDTGVNGRNAVACDDHKTQYLLSGGAPGVAQGAAVEIEVTREAIPGLEPWKRPLARLRNTIAKQAPGAQGRLLAFPSPNDELARLGWDDLLDEARHGLVRFPGGDLRISATPAMTLIDVDGYLPPEQLSELGATAAAAAIRRLDIGGSIGIDLPTSGRKTARHSAAAIIDAALPRPFERTAVNGFGFIQIVRPRSRPSLIELAQDRAAFEARALLRQTAREATGAKRLVAPPKVFAVLEAREDWIAALSSQIGGRVELRANSTIPMSGGYAEPL